MSLASKFKWTVAPSGYRWGSSSSRAEDDAVLLPLQDEGPRETSPVDDHTGLFRTFADAKPDRENILLFADRHGRLTVADLAEAPAGVSSGRQSEARERLSLWIGAIKRMKFAVALWLECRDADDAQKRDKDSEALDRIQRLVEDNWEDLRSASRTAKTHPRFPPAPLELLEPMSSARTPRQSASDRLEAQKTAGIEVVKRIINDQLAGHVTPALSTDKKPQTYWELLPADLLAALWLQFAMAVEDQKNYRRCDSCGDWFEAPKDPTRTNQRFCSVTCRNRGHRGKKQKAIELWKQGLHDKAIARAIMVPVETLGRWLHRLRGDE